MNLIKKAFLFYRKEGVKNTLIRISEKLWEITIHFPFFLKEKVFWKHYFYKIELSNSLDILKKNLKLRIKNIDTFLIKT